MWYNRLVLDAQLSKTTCWWIFPAARFTSMMRVFFDVIFCQLTAHLRLSNLEDWNLDCLEDNDRCLSMMESCLCTIVALDDGHQALRHLVEMSNRFPGCRFRIWEPLEALLQCIGHDRLFFHQKWRLVTLPWNTQQTKPSLSEKILVFVLRHPFYQLRLGWLSIYDHFGNCRSHLCQSFLSENRIFIVSSFRKGVRAQFENFFLFSLCSSVSSAWFDYILIRSKKQIILQYPTNTSSTNI